MKIRRNTMKKLTTLALASLIAVTLAMPAWSQGNSAAPPAPAAQKDTQKATSATAPAVKKHKKSKKAKAAAKKANTDNKNAVTNTKK
jgi:hypothetical protein